MLVVVLANSITEMVLMSTSSGGKEQAAVDTTSMDAMPNKTSYQICAGYMACTMLTAKYMAKISAIQI